MNFSLKQRSVTFAFLETRIFTSSKAPASGYFFLDFISVPSDVPMGKPKTREGDTISETLEERGSYPKCHCNRFRNEKKKKLKDSSV